MDQSRLEAEFFQLYETEADALFRFVFFRVNDREVARDIVQESFTKMWEVLVSDQSIENQRAFLYRIASNKVIDWYRKHKEYSLNELAQSGFDRAQEESLPIGEAIDIHSAVDELKGLASQDQELLWLRFVEDWSVKDIAASLGESENVVSVRIHRGLARWRQRIRFGGSKNSLRPTSKRRTV